jgi:hypothetical protein
MKMKEVHKGLFVGASKKTTKKDVLAFSVFVYLFHYVYR